jgi:hypothetical protein
MYRLVVAHFTTLLLCCPYSAASQQGWVQHTIAEHGIKVSLPTKPQRRELPLASRDGTLTIYESIEATNPQTKYSIFVGAPVKQGIYEPESVEAFLSGHVTGMVRGVNSGKLVASSRKNFRGRPAVEYEFAHRLEGIAYVGRGVTVMVDGGHIRVSMWHPASDSKASERFRRFVDSFELVPIQFVAAQTRFTDPRGITFSPPSGWLPQPTGNPVEVARYTHLTRSLQLLVAGVPSYTCNSFVSEIRASGRLKSAAPLKLGDRHVVRLYSFEDIPKYKVRLTTVQYCQDSRIGAVVLGGSEEEPMFDRWAGVYEGAAATLQAP